MDNNQWFLFSGIEHKEIKTASYCLDYLTWDNTNWTAIFHDGYFVHYRNGDKNNCHTEDFLYYKDINYNNFRLDIKGDKILISPNGDISKSREVDAIEYIGWDRKKWRAELLKLINHLHPDL